MGRIYFKRPIDVPTVDTYSSNVESTAGFRAYGGGMQVPVFTAATGTTLVSYGFHKIGSTAAKTYKLASPSAGRDVIIAAVNGASSGVQMTVRMLTAGAHIASSQSSVVTLRKITFADGDDMIHLMGVTTAKYAVIGTYGSPAIATS